MANQGTLIVVPPNVDQPIALKAFLSRLVEEIDKAFGFRGSDPFLTSSDVESFVSGAALETTSKSIQEVLQEYTDEQVAALKEELTGLIEGLEYTNNPEQPAIVDLSYTAQTAGASYDQVEAQQTNDDLATVANKVDAILVALRAAEIIET